MTLEENNVVWDGRGRVVKALRVPTENKDKQVQVCF
jgi:hypothetical protein